MGTLVEFDSARCQRAKARQREERKAELVHSSLAVSFRWLLDHGFEDKAKDFVSGASAELQDRDPENGK